MHHLITTRSSLLDDFFKDVAPGFYVKPLHGDPLPAQIRVEVRETAQGYCLEAELPGVSKEDIHITVDGAVVSLRAEVRQADRQTEGSKVLRSERYYGAVARTVQLPQELDSANARARFDNGVLVLDLPRRVATTSQRVRID
jgi:HSP20 family protein